MNQTLLQVWAVITADRKKAIALGVLALVAGGLWVRAALTAGPSRARAEDQPAIVTLPGAAAEAENASEPDLRRTVVFAPPPPLDRDLFALSDALVSLSAQTDRAGAGPPKSASGSDDNRAGLSGSARTTEDRVREEASSLRLRSTMIGASPIAVIETPGGRRQGVLVRVGDRVEGFRILAIRTHEVELEKDGVRVTLARTPREP